jgi:hypothetical protein
MESTRFAASPIALKIAVAVLIECSPAIESEWSNKDAGVRSFAIAAQLGMSASAIDINVAIASLFRVLWLVVGVNQADPALPVAVHPKAARFHPRQKSRRTIEQTASATY